MSIVTKTGDDGTTGLMYNRRVPKTHSRVATYGAVDELNAALGLARATATEDFIRDNILQTQKELVILMGELATVPQDRERYLKDGFSLVDATMTSRLESLVKEIEAQKITYQGWATPGASIHSAALDVARTVCRRAERGVCSLKEAGELGNHEIILYVNRLSDLLWLFARWTEQRGPTIGN